MHTMRNFPVGNQPEIKSVRARKTAWRLQRQCFQHRLFLLFAPSSLFTPNFNNTSSRVNDINAFEIKRLILNLESVLLRFEAVIAMWPIRICYLLVHGELLFLLAMCQKYQTNTYKIQLLVYLTRLKLFLIPLQCCASHSSLLFW